jgi:hypothetical protein
MPSVQWNEIFELTVSPIDLFIRGTVIYLFIFVLMRMLRREPGIRGTNSFFVHILFSVAERSRFNCDSKAFFSD